MPTIPARLADLFWDCDFEGISLAGHRDFIIRRILDRGDWESMQWLREAVGDEAITAWLLRKKGGGLDAPKLRFWELMLDLPKEEVDTWVAEARASVWGRRNRQHASPTTLTACDDCDRTSASLDELACMKLAVVAQRGSRKDFADVYAICQRHKPLPDLLQLYQRKYGTSDISHVLVSLGYFDDAEDEAPPAMIWDASWEEIKRVIRTWVKGMA